MEELLVSLQNLLNRHIGLHRQLLEMVRQEHEALTQIDLKEIQEITFSKEALIYAIQVCEKERKEVSEKLGVQSMEALIQALENNQRMEQAKGFRSAFTTLKLLIERIKDQNDQNSTLVENSLEHVQNMKKNLLGLSETRSNTYSSQGQAQGSGESKPRLIEKEA